MDVTESLENEKPKNYEVAHINYIINSLQA